MFALVYSQVDAGLRVVDGRSNPKPAISRLTRCVNCRSNIRSSVRTRSISQRRFPLVAADPDSSKNGNSDMEHLREMTFAQPKLSAVVGRIVDRLAHPRC